MSQIGFLGLGSMGAVMAHRLIEAGHDVVVWNRSPGAVAEAVSVGATPGESPAQALAASVSLSMLADDAAALEVLVPDPATAAGTVHVNLASISPAAAAELAARFTSAGARYVAAPVLGRPDVARRGALNILAAGPSDAVAQVTPVLDVLGARVWRMGDDPAQANATKIAVNYLIIHAIQAIGESIALVEARGIRPELFIELVTSTLFDGVVYRGYGSAIAAQDYSPPGFAMPLGLKDLGLVAGLAAEGDRRLPSWPVLRQVFDAAMADPDLRDSDWAAAAEVTRRGLL